MAAIQGFLLLGFIVLIIASCWSLFEKAGEAGFKSIIPIYNFFIFLKISGRGIGTFLLMFVPFVNIIVMIMMYLDFLEKFNQPKWHIILVIFFSYFYFPYLAFIIKPEYKA